MQKPIPSPHTQPDWHRADIIAAIRKRGTTLSAVARANGLASNTLQNALRIDWPKGQRIIAAVIGVDAAEIWPSRYPSEFSTTANKDAHEQTVGIE